MNRHSEKTLSWKARIFLVVFGLLLGGALLETTVRIFLRPAKNGSEFANLQDLRRAMMRDEAGTKDTGSVSLSAIIHPHPDDRIIYDLRPNLKVQFQRVPVTTNSWGMRDKERALVKTPGTYRIALLGDSFAFGWGVEDHETFARKLEEQLHRLHPSIEFEVLNFGIPGYSTFQEVERFKQLAIDFNPDAVMIYFVQNDFGYPFFVRDVHTPGGILSAVRFARLSWKAVDPDIETERLRLMSLDPNSAITELSDITRQKGIHFSVVFNPHPKWKSDYSRIPVLRKRKDIQVIRLRKSLLEYVERHNLDPKKLSLPHDPHPSPLRHRILGSLLASHYMTMLRSEIAS